MNVIIDDESQFLLKSNPATLADVLLEVTDFIHSSNRAIQIILLNGKNITPEELTLSFGQTSVADVESLEVRTAQVSELVTSSLDEVAEVIPELPVACHELAQILAGEDPASCFAQFNQFLDIWEILKERQGQVINLLEADVSAMQVGSQSVEAHNTKLAGLIKNARSFMEASDFVSLSDLLSHDLSALAEIEEEIIARLRKMI